MCPILDGYGVTGVFYFPYTPSCEPRLTAGYLNTCVVREERGEGGVGWYSPVAGAVHNRAAACVAAGGGIFENQL